MLLRCVVAFGAERIVGPFVRYPPVTGTEPCHDRQMPAAGSSTRAGDRLALAAALATVSAWASAFVAIRAVSDDLSPGAMSLLRLSVSSVLLAALATARREPLPRRSALGGAALCGVLWFGVYNVALASGERVVDSGTAAMLVNIGPVLIALLAGVVLREGFPRPLLIGGGIGLAGICVIALGVSDGHAPLRGVLLCLLAAAAYAGGVVAQKPALACSSVVSVTLVASLVGTAACLPFAPALADELPRAPAFAIAGTIYLGVVSGALGFVAWGYALKRTSAGRAASMTLLVPPIAVLLGWVALGETPPPLGIAGGLIALCGVIVARRRGGPPELAD